MEIFIKTIDGNKFVLEVNPSDTILLVKYKIEELKNIQVQSQRLLFQGYPLLDENILQNREIQNNSVIHLLYQMSTMSADTPK